MLRMLKYLETIREEDFLVKEMFLVFQRKLLLVDKTKVVQFVLFYLADTNKKSVSSFISVLLSNVLDHCHAEDDLCLNTQKSKEK